MEVRTTKRYLYLQGCIEMQKKPVLFWYYYSSKDYLKVKDLVIFAVAPHAGAWIEIAEEGVPGSFVDVAPHAGAWIAISAAMFPTVSRMLLSTQKHKTNVRL